MHRVIAFAIVGLLLSALPVLAESGDVNEDGRIDKDDVRLIDNYLNGSLLLQDSQIAAADADRDGKITSTDRDLLQRRLGGLAVGTPRSAAASQSQIDLRSADSGVVVDKATGKPLAGVEVSLPDEGVTVRTDSEGRFKLPGTTPGKILSAKASNYAPSSVTTQSGRGFELQLERLSPRLQVLDDNLYHLGDNNYDRRSANAGQFQMPASGTSYSRGFMLARAPQNDLILRIGSVIGIDTNQSIAVGQSNLPPSRERQANAGVQILLNGRPIRQLVLNGDNITTPLPLQLLRPGFNEITIKAALINRNPNIYDPLGLLGQFSSLADFVPGAALDYDDIEFTHLVVLDPSGVVLPAREP